MKQRLITFIIIMFFGCLLTINNFCFFSNLKNDKTLIDAVVVNVDYVSFLRCAEIELQDRINTGTIYANIRPYSLFTISKDDRVKVKFLSESQRYMICPSNKDYLAHTIIIWLLVIVFLYLGFKIIDY